MSVDNFKKASTALIRDQILEIGSFLLYVKEGSRNKYLTEDDLRNLSFVYCRLWWFRDKLIKKYFPKQDFTDFPEVLNKKFAKQSKLDLDILLSRNPNLLTLVSLPSIFKKDITNTKVFFDALNTQKISDGLERIVNLSTRGELRYGPTGVYKMKTDQKRYKLIRYLVDQKGYHPTKTLTEILGYTSVKATGNEILKINSIIAGSIGLRDFIKNSNNEGYGINSNYNVVIIK